MTNHRLRCLKAATNQPRAPSLVYRSRHVLNSLKDIAAARTITQRRATGLPKGGDTCSSTSPSERIPFRSKEPDDPQLGKFAYGLLNAIFSSHGTSSLSAALDAKRPSDRPAASPLSLQTARETDGLLGIARVGIDWLPCEPRTPIGRAVGGRSPGRSSVWHLKLWDYLTW